MLISVYLIQGQICRPMWLRIAWKVDANKAIQEDFENCMYSEHTVVFLTKINSVLIVNCKLINEINKKIISPA